MEKRVIQNFSLKLINEIMPLEKKYHKYLNRDSLMLELFSMTRQLVENYKEGDQGECLEAYAQYITDVSELLTLGNKLALPSEKGIQLDVAIEEFLKENNLEK